MNESVQARTADRPRYVVGMDAHSRKLAISVWECEDPWRPVLCREVRCCLIADLVPTYERLVPADSLTLIEASTNSRSLKNTLAAAGFRAEVVKADLLSGREAKRKVRDIQDARNLALAYIRGDVRDFVWTPSDDYAEYRDVHFCYRDAVKELTRTSNRIWSICSQRGLRLPIRAGATKAAEVRRMAAELGAGGFVRERLEMLVADYEFMLARRRRIERAMAEAVLREESMMRLMQLPGFYLHAAFAIAAVVEDARRFPSASKLVAYAGMSPTLDTSGEEEDRAARRGGTGKPLDPEGRSDLRHYCCEAGQAVLNLCARTPVGKWGWAMVNRGKPKNKVACAVGHKLIMYAWHILRGDPTPNREGEGMFRRKMKRFYSELGRERMSELGYGSRDDFAAAMAAKLYGHLPEARPAM